MSLGILSYLDDMAFGACTAREALNTAQTLIRVLQRYGWLVHPTKCVGTTEAVQVFQALGTVVDLALQTFSVPESTVRRILDAAHALATGPPMAPVRVVARLKGLISATWISVGSATRIRTRAFAAVIDSRPDPRSESKRETRRCWSALVPISDDARREALWWCEFLPRLNGQPIRPRPFDASVDGDIYSDASDTGAGAHISSLPSRADASSLVRALLARAPPGSTEAEIISYSIRGIEYVAPFPLTVARASSTYRELFGIARFIHAIAPLLCGGRFRVFLDNLGCVFILGGVVPEFAIGGKHWGEYVTGGSPNDELQSLALDMFQAQLDKGFELQAVWLPRALNARADYLSRVSEMRHHDYRLRPDVFRRVDAAWGPHTVDRFASFDSRQTARFCSHYFHPEAEWVDAFSASWAGETNWLFPPATVSAIGQTIAHLLSCRALGTLIVPLSPWSSWRVIVRPRDNWAPFIMEVRHLGEPSSCLIIPRRYRDLFSDSALYALRLDGRRGSGPSSRGSP